MFLFIVHGLQTNKEKKKQTKHENRIQCKEFSCSFRKLTFQSLLLLLQQRGLLESQEKRLRNLY